MTDALLVAVLVEVPVVAVIGLLAVRRMVNRRQKALADALRRRIHDLRVDIAEAETGVKDHLTQRINLLADAVTGLADASRAILSSPARKPAAASAKTVADKPVAAKGATTRKVN